MKSSSLNRRTFIMSGAAAAAAGCAGTRTRSVTLAQSHYKSPNEKLNVGGIGVGGKGYSDIMNCRSENIVAIADVDWRHGSGAINRLEKAEKYKDFRKMLDEHPEIDAVTISTPDHMHAIAAMECMNRGIHVFVQKPLAHTVEECRLLKQTAREKKLTTQMGNQGASSKSHRVTCETIWAGTIGTVREVHSWTDRPIGWWPQGVPDPLPEQPVPDHLDWDLWLGPAPKRPYNEGYCPFKWRGWWDYGCGALGDIACHTLSPVVKALQLEHPASVECIHQKDVNSQTFPTESIIRYTFAPHGGFDEIKLYWYDGKLKPNKPEGLKDHLDKMGLSTGTLFVGDKAILVMGGAADKRNALIVDGEIIENFERPDPLVPRIPEIINADGNEDSHLMHMMDFIRCCKTGDKPSSNFDHAGTLSEWVIMGNNSLRYPYEELKWDGEAMRFTNKPEANQYVGKDYRKGWAIV